MGRETITWLGHSSFRLETADGTRIYVHPWLTNPNCPEGEREPERIDVLAITHGHDDHLGETTLDLCRRHRPSIVAINELSWWLEAQLGSDHDFQRMNRGGTHSVGGVRISMTDDATPQGQGIGRAVLTVGLHSADKQELPCYLETLVPKNVVSSERRGLSS